MSESLKLLFDFRQIARLFGFVRYLSFKTGLPNGSLTGWLLDQVFYRSAGSMDESAISYIYFSQAVYNKINTGQASLLQEKNHGFLCLHLLKSGIAPIFVLACVGCLLSTGLYTLHSLQTKGAIHK